LIDLTNSTQLGPNKLFSTWLMLS